MSITYQDVSVILLHPLNSIELRERCKNKLKEFLCIKNFYRI